MCSSDLGLQVVIAGQPNVGKSSLLNALAGAELAIVTPIAGTTRDVVRQDIQIEGVPLHIIDTAGLREATDEVERIGIERAWSQIGDADAVLFVHDLTRLAEPDYKAADAQIRTQLAQAVPHGVPMIELYNKADLGDVGDSARAASPAGGLSIRVSARTGAGLSELRQALLDVAGWQSGAEGLCIARERHVQALRRTKAHLEHASSHLAAMQPMLDLLAEELRLAQNALNEITGVFSSDDLLGAIFSNFCIGK